MSTVNIGTKMLADAVLSIPDAGFKGVPAELRKALLNKVAAVDNQVLAGAIGGANNNLQNDVEWALQNWLVDGYSVSSPLQYTKAQILALVEDVIQRLGA